MALRFAASNNEIASAVRDQQDLQYKLENGQKNIVTHISKSSSDRNIIEQLRVHQATLENDLKAAIQNIKQLFPRYAELMRREPLSVSETQELLGEDEALLTLTPGWDDKQTHVFLVSRSGLTVQTVDFSLEEMEQLVTQLREGIDISTGKLQPFPLDAAYELYRRLFSGLDADLGRYHHIVYVPTGAMGSLPLSLLVNEAPTSETSYKDAAWVTKRHTITRLPVVGTLKALRLFAGQSNGNEPLKGFGDPVLEGKGTTLRGLKIVTLYKGQAANTDAVRALPPLPDTAVELRQIAHLLGANDNALYLGEAATETAAKTVNLSSSRVVAFATHGLVAGDLGHLAEPALVLTPPQEGTPKDDGLLTASEIAQLKLDADWVILSACNTAAAEKPGAEGLSGLARAFIYAGARSLLVSHWPVETRAATQLTTGLFTALKRDGKLSKAEALRHSMLQLASTKGFEHPAFWAPFSLVGARR